MALITIKHKRRIGDKVIVDSGSSIIYNVEDKAIIAECPARSNKSKTTISDDKLFLMGGQSSKNQNENQKTNTSEEGFCILLKAAAHLNFLNGRT